MNMPTVNMPSDIYESYSIFSKNVSSIVNYIHPTFEYVSFDTFKDILTNKKVITKYNVRIFSIKRKFYIPKIKIRVNCGIDYYNITLITKNLIEMFIQFNDILFLFNYKLTDEKLRFIINKTINEPVTINNYGSDLTHNIFSCRKRSKYGIKFYLNAYVPITYICRKIQLPIVIYDGPYIDKNESTSISTQTDPTNYEKIVKEVKEVKEIVDNLIDDVILAIEKEPIQGLTNIYDNLKDVDKLIKSIYKTCN